MTGYQILKDSVLRVFRNLDDALAISGLIWLGAIALVVIVSSGAPELTVEPTSFADVPPEVLMNSLLTNIILVIAGIWVAVEWHRYILLGVRPKTLIPKLRLDLTFAYFGKSVLFMLIMMAGLIPLIIVVIIASAVLPQAIVMMLPMVFFFISYYGFMRASPVFPKTAMGEKITIKQAFQSTEPYKNAISQLTFLSVVISFFIQALMLFMPSGVIGFVASLIVGWVMLIVNVSVLTSIYKLTTKDAG